MNKPFKFFVLVVSLSVVNYFIISTFLVKQCIVKGDSMYPTLYNDELLYIKPYIKTYKVGDIITLVDPEVGSYCVKRIIAVEGQTVELTRTGKVYVNGIEFYEPYLTPHTKTFSYKQQTEIFTCKKDEYFVLGDNRGNSADSRVYGVLPKRNIVGLIRR